MLPILYIDVPDFGSDSDDEAKAVASQFQYIDWRDLRLEESSSSVHLRGVNAMAARLVRERDAVAERPITVGEGMDDRSTRLLEAREAFRDDGSEADSSDQPGILDVIAEAEGAFPEWSKTMEEMGEILARIGELGESASADMARSEAAGKGAAGKVVAAHRLANELAEPVARFVALATRYAGQARSVDGGFRAVVELAEESEETEERQQACELFSAVRGFAVVSAENVNRFQELSKTLTEVSRFSRDLRKPLARLQDGIRSVIDAHEIVDGWMARISASSIDCSDIPLEAD
jgi:hypothetical protein